jgi:hypothetical protein
MASIKNLYSSKVIQPGFETNYGVDFVIHFKLSADSTDGPLGSWNEKF